jgi:hypothetical protein
MTQQCNEVVWYSKTRKQREAQQGDEAAKWGDEGVEQGSEARQWRKWSTKERSGREFILFLKKRICEDFYFYFFLKLWSKHPKSKPEQRHLRTQHAQFCEHTQLCEKKCKKKEVGRKIP